MSNIKKVKVHNVLHDIRSDAYVKPVSGIPAADLADGVIPDISGKADKDDNAVEGNFAAFDENGNPVDSGHKHSDYITEHQDISGKADKDTDAVDGNVAKFDSSGNPVDGGTALPTIVEGAALGATAYQKPSDGIPDTDLSSSVQSSLSNADSAVQPSDLGDLAEHDLADINATASGGSYTPASTSKNLVTQVIKEPSFSVGTGADANTLVITLTDKTAATGSLNASGTGDSVVDSIGAGTFVQPSVSLAYTQND